MIVQANANDTGMYRCHAENPYSSADSAISISVKGMQHFFTFFVTFMDKTEAVF